MISRLLFYLLLILLPVQIGRHFFFNFSLIKGLYSDYSIPVLYATDILAVLIIFTRLKIKFSRLQFRLEQLRKNPLKIFLVATLFFLLLNVLFIASVKWAALYKLVKIMELVLLGRAIGEIKPGFSRTVFFLSVGAAYSSILAVWQFILQRSANGFWWYLGERTFSVTTPGIAAINWQGHLVLRSYGTFPHPNVLAGFLVLVICLIFSLFINRKRAINPLTRYWLVLVCMMSFAGLLLTFSRLSWLFLCLGIFLTFMYSKYRKNDKKTGGDFFVILLYLYIFLSVTFPAMLLKWFSFGGESLQERADLIYQAVSLISSNPLTGVGLNNSVIRAVDLLPGGFGLYFFQPVHNIYLLVTTETGLIGFFLFLIFLSAAIYRSLRPFSPYLPVILLMVFLGGFDHYLLTLQQGMLMFVIFLSLAFLPENDVN